jgi:SAM-dependent methyltransferase
MDQFRNPTESHAHSLNILKLLYEYDDFMDSLTVIADMGCGSGLDTEWWATLMDRQEPPEPHNYLCYAVDRDITRIDPEILKLGNIKAIQGNFEERVIPRQVDLMWCHDAFQYAIDPLKTLKVWNETMNVNGMLVLSIPMHESYQYNRMVTRSMSGSFYHYNLCNLMYMLAVNGFDCRDCFFHVEENSPWLYAAVYKSDVQPMNPLTTSWFDLAEKRLVNDSVIGCLNKYGHVRQEELIFTWLDKDFHFAKN